jgi:hypothetical protein
MRRPDVSHDNPGDRTGALARPVFGRSVDEVRIPNRATYWPVAPVDLLVGAPLAARLLLGATPAGRALHAAVLAAYVGCAVEDWRERRAVRRIDFLRHFGADTRHLIPMPPEARAADVRTLTERLNDEFTPRRLPRPALAVEVDRCLTEYMAGITGQHVRTSVEIRGATLARLVFPFALGACDVLSGDIAIFRDAGVLEPHVIAHEFCHRKGYWKELHAQVLAYFALAGSPHPVLRQAAVAERLYRHLRVLAAGDEHAFRRLVAESKLRGELRAGLLRAVRPDGAVSRRVDAALRALYDARMRATGQNGVSDYDLGFTSFLYTAERGRPSAA